jgi:hypothetical protein
LPGLPVFIHAAREAGVPGLRKTNRDDKVN